MERYYKRSKERMAKLVFLDAPDVIVANEARILLRCYHGGNWPAIRHWIWLEICRHASNAWLEVQIVWWRARRDLTRDEALDLIIDRMEQKENRKGVKPAADNPLRWEILKALKESNEPEGVSVYQLSRRLHGRFTLDEIIGELAAMDLDGEIKNDLVPRVKITPKGRKSLSLAKLLKQASEAERSLKQARTGA
jgi:hypothetical protein